jgi:hypothetical protein
MILEMPVTSFESVNSRCGLCVFLDSDIYFLFFYFKHMYNFLAQPNAITHLDLSNTECSLDMVIFLYIALEGLRIAI